jgi:formamidopyrimidine-DNA glycosylase
VPELPEVETVVRDLRPLLVGHRIASVERVSKLALRKPWKTPWNRALVGQTIHSVGRRGKWIVLDLDEDQSLVFHLGMTGQLTVVAADDPVLDHTHLVFGLADGSTKNQLRFRDIRRFGSATLFSTRADLDRSFVEAGLGPEPFDLDAGYWREQLAKTARSLKAVLLDQTVVAGVGNIYADEALFHARLHPARLGRDLTRAEADRLRRAIVIVLSRAIERRGSSIRNYVGGSGLRGGYQEEFRVYDHKGQPCLRCGTPIALIRLAGRASHFCPRCQKGEASESPQHKKPKTERKNSLSSLTRTRKKTRD